MTVGPIRVILVGAGHRAMIYGGFQDRAPDRMRVVGVVDPSSIRRRIAADRFGIAAEHQWESIADLPPSGAVATAAINGTGDRAHVPTAVELLDKGYDILLEKPIGTSAAELFVLEDAARRAQRHVHICHVLRHTPFYRKIRELVADGRSVGTVINIEMAENVSYDHIAVSYVRGSFSHSRFGSTMLLAKSCHDLDLMAWMMSGIDPVRTVSTGNRMYFTEENAPEGSGTRCLVDCRIEDHCPYSAKRNYVDNEWWQFYPWQSIEHLGSNPTREQKLESLRTDNPYGRCVWQTDSDLVDHQVVMVEFAGGATGSMSMIGNSARPSRTIHIIGTLGEVFGELHSGEITLRRIPSSGPERAHTDVFHVEDGQEMHGGGDLRLVDDFIAVLQGAQPSISTSSLQDSINGHLIGFAAEASRQQERWVHIRELHPATSAP